MKKHGTWILAAVLLATPLLAQENTPELLAWWMFNEEDGGTTLLDWSGNEFNAGILAPEQVWRVVDPVIGTALWFDGTTVLDDPLMGGGYVVAEELADQLFEPMFSVAAWICPESLPPYAPVLTKVTDTETWADGFGLYIEETGKLGAFVNGYDGHVMLGGDGRVNAWTHLCLTFDGTTAKFYVNGQLRSSAEPGSSAVVNAAPVCIGTLAGWETWAWHGAIADARVYASALSAADVTALFSSSPASLVADSDGDGMPDVWELRFGLNPLNPNDASQIRHASDGFTNLQKYRLGMNPLKAAVVSTTPLLKVYTPMEK